MSNESLQIRVKKFKAAAEHVFNTPKGIELLAYLKDDYVDRTAIGQTAEITYYRLGQKELIQSLIQVVNEPQRLEEIIVKSGVTSDEL